ncbi:MAG: caspase family protein [Thermodesulfobacteriota bacterium]
MLYASFPTISPFVRSLVTRSVILFLLYILLSLSVSTSEALSAPPSGSGDEFLVVDCLLPGQIRKLGKRTTFLTARRAIKTSAGDCEIRGGEYVSYDRSNYATALKVWLPQAEEGDATAQTYVGEIYEKGLGLQPDYVLAAQWYSKAAEKGYARAQVNLGHLYEKGLGVEKDPSKALSWYRKASGLPEAIVIESGSVSTETQKELKELREEVERRKQESESLREQLIRTQEQLEQTRKELERRKSEVETEQQRLEETREELERKKQQAESTGDDAEVKRLEGQLKQREGDLEHQSREMIRLRKDIAKLESEAENNRKELAKLSEEKKGEEKKVVEYVGPAIEMIDPLLSEETRGLTPPRIKTRSGIERVIVGRVTAPSGLLTFTFNDREEKLDENGLFRLKTLVQSSSTPVKLVAIDRQGKRASVEFLLTPEAEVKPPPPIQEERESQTSIGFGEYYALIIGNKEYTYWPRLKTPQNDAIKIDRVLREKYGFKTKLLINATRRDILEALNEYRKTLTEKDNLLIYYAGHGHLDEKISRGYWVPVDGETDSPVQWIPTFAITDFLSGMSAKHVLVVADSCYSGALTRSAIARLEAGMSDEARRNWIKITSAKRSRTVLSSGDLTPVLDTGGSGGSEDSVFAKALLTILTENNEILEGQKLYTQIAAQVAYAASPELEQIPQYAPIQYAGHESGDFLFVPK